MSEATRIDSRLSLRAPAGTPTTLRVFREQRPEVVLEQCTHPDAVGRRLESAGIPYERVSTLRPLDGSADPETVGTVYRSEIERMMRTGGYGSFDVIGVTPESPGIDSLREKFLDEHVHTEDEVRFFVSGHGLFSMHLGDEVFELLCTSGDLVNVPAGTRHWFDMGPYPDFTAVRLFTNPGGWVAQFTGSDIASRFSRLDNHPL